MPQQLQRQLVTPAAAVVPPLHCQPQGCSSALQRSSLAPLRQQLQHQQAVPPALAARLLLCSGKRQLLRLLHQLLVMHPLQHLPQLLSTHSQRCPQAPLRLHQLLLALQ